MTAFLEAQSVTKLFPIRRGILGRQSKYLTAVEDVSLDIREGESLGIVGESGCGKSTLIRCILRLLEPNDGRIFVDGKDIAHIAESELKPLRRQMQIVFQDPYSALHPRKTVEKLVEEPLRVHAVGSKSDTRDRVTKMLLNVGLSEQHMKRYPHELSGGQRQRVMIARSLILQPRFVALDEPTSALDASVQATILNLLKKLRKDFHISYLVVSHNLHVVQFLSDMIGVMYLGNLVELGSREEVFSAPLHPYTRALAASIPLIDEVNERTEIGEVVLHGELPNPANPPPGCRFHTRCPQARPVCREKRPELRKGPKGRLVACHFDET